MAAIQCTPVPVFDRLAVVFPALLVVVSLAPLAPGSAQAAPPPTAPTGARPAGGQLFGVKGTYQDAPQRLEALRG